MYRPDSILARESAFGREILDGEIAAFRVSTGNARAHLRARLVQLGTVSPWVALHVASSLGTELHTEVTP